MMTMDEAKVAQDVDAYVDTGIEDLKRTIEELEAMPENERWRNDPAGLCYEAQLNMARARLEQLEKSKADRARS